MREVERERERERERGELRLQQHIFCIYRSCSNKSGIALHYTTICYYHMIFDKNEYSFTTLTFNIKTINELVSRYKIMKKKNNFYSFNQIVIFIYVIELVASTRNWIIEVSIFFTYLRFFCI